MVQVFEDDNGRMYIIQDGELRPITKFQLERMQAAELDQEARDNFLSTLGTALLFRGVGGLIGGGKSAATALAKGAVKGKGSTVKLASKSASAPQLGKSVSKVSLKKGGSVPNIKIQPKTRLSGYQGGPMFSKSASIGQLPGVADKALSVLKGVKQKAEALGKKVSQAAKSFKTTKKVLKKETKFAKGTRTPSTPDLSMVSMQSLNKPGAALSKSKSGSASSFQTVPLDIPGGSGANLIPKSIQSLNSIQSSKFTKAARQLGVPASTAISIQRKAKQLKATADRAVQNAAKKVATKIQKKKK